MPDHWAGGLQVQGRSLAGLQAVVHAAHIPAAGAIDSETQMSLMYVSVSASSDDAMLPWTLRSDICSCRRRARVCGARCRST
jgi:hypothetical protein